MVVGEGEYHMLVKGNTHMLVKENTHMLVKGKPHMFSLAPYITQMNSPKEVWQHLSNMGL